MARAAVNTKQNLHYPSESMDAASGVTYAATDCTLVDELVITAPDGTLTVAKLTEGSGAGLQPRFSNNGAAGWGLSNLPTAGDIVTYSIYLKGAGRTIAKLSTATGTPNAWFNLSGAGSVGTTNGLISSSIERDTRDTSWYRCSITFVWVASYTVFFRVNACTTDGATSYTGDGTSGLYVWGYQVVKSNWAGDYQVTTAAVYNVGGLRNKNIISQNLLLQSENFSVTWGGLNTTRGVQTITDSVDGAPTTHYVSQSYTTLTKGSNVTFRVKGQAGTKSQILLYANLTTSVDRATFDLGTGAVSALTGANAVDARMTLASDGFYICELVYKYDSDIARVYMGSAGSATYQGDGTGTVLLKEASVMDANHCVYVQTTTSVVNTGTPRNLVPTRQNFIVQSEDFSSGSWIKLNSTVGANAITAPDGTLTADALLDDTTNGNHHFRQLYSTVPALGTVNTISVFAKVGTKSWIEIAANSGAIGAWFNLTTGIKGSTAGANVISSQMDSVGNGWYRCSLTFTSATLNDIRLLTTTADGGGQTYIGDGSAAAYFWGAQVVQANHSGIYTPTTTAIVNTGNIRNKVSNRVAI